MSDANASYNTLVNQRLTFSMSAVARNIAYHNLKQAETCKNSMYDLAVVRIFSAFMIEGTLEYIGSVLEGNRWYNSKGYGPETMNAYTRIVKLIGLPDKDNEYSARQNIIKTLKEYRNLFAHPKLHTDKNSFIVEGIASDNQKPRLPAKWEKNLSIMYVENEYNSSVELCLYLLDKAADYLEGMDDILWSDKFSHIQDTNHEAINMRGLLHGLEHMQLNSSSLIHKT